MVKIAVDVVLLPSEEVADRTIEINKQLIEKTPSPLQLHKTKCLPHLSLDIGAVEEKDLPQIKTVLKDILRHNPIKKLIITKAYTITLSSGTIYSSFEIKKTKELQALHEAIMNGLAPFMSQDITKEMEFNPAEVSDHSLNYAIDYPKKYAFENFNPHITIGHGMAKVDGKFPMEFKPSKLAVCYLGSNNTCRKLLVEIDL